MRVAPVALLVVLALAACGGSQRGAERTPASPAPALTGATLDGGSFSLAALRGRPVMLNAWASW
jgi:cytochrome c biogenesis protein CcmG/thiol:disulfide interchange protein DsbE